MSKLLLLALLGFGGYYLYEKMKAQPSVGALPSDANLVKTLTIAGQSVNVYLSASGYYLQSPTLNNKILGPYSTAQVSAALGAQSSISNLMASL